MRLKQIVMSTPSPAPQASAPTPPKFCPLEMLKPFLAPYYLTVAAVLGAITAGFVVVFLLLAIVAANFNVLGWIE
jgi:hypothetical protein